MQSATTTRRRHTSGVVATARAKATEVSEIMVTNDTSVAYLSTIGPERRQLVWPSNIAVNLQ